MKVYYPGPGEKTYHPQLGKLVKDEKFELDDNIAKPYVESGLLKGSKLKAQSSKLKAESNNEEPKPRSGVKNKKIKSL